MDIKSQLLEFYESNAVRRENTEKSNWKIMLRERFLHLMNEYKLTRLLEIGAGTGQDSLYFMENGLDVSCIDLSPKHVGYCLEKGLNARIMDFYHMDFNDGHFQGLFALNCLLHVPFDELENVLKEINRVLDEDGIVFIGNYGGNDREIVRETPNGIGLRFFSSMSYERYKKKLIEAGFVILESGIQKPKDGPSFNFFIMGKNKSGETG
ncbi:MAG: class I SAM-dependent methyltransferase [Clostridia bacterium]|nr:class I SAM-dependent methyltransferase [Clostridia bacterium]